MNSLAPSSPSRHLQDLHPATAGWFSQVFEKPTVAQKKAWPEIAAGQSTLLLAPTGSGKTLAAFLVAIDRIMFGSAATRAASRSEGSEKASRKDATSRTRVLYVSPFKALGVDVERNLKAPLAGIRAVAQREGYDFHLPTIGVRSGDTPSSERARLAREPADILITTPESLYLILTSRARETLSAVDTLIIDEIHSLVSNKRGAHLFLTLERLERLRLQNDPESAPLQRIGLSATQRPLDEIARLLSGAKASPDPEEIPIPRPVKIVEAGRRKNLDLSITVPVEDMSDLAQAQVQSGAASAGPSIPSIWPSIHPKLVELIREHRSTMIFANSRRLAERLAASINEVADEEIALAHHGSIAKETRLRIEDRLKRGQLPAIVATSSLELGVDMSAVDLVIQIEAPPSIASGLQRIGRAGHQVDARSKGIVFPKYRGDLLACSAAVGRMYTGEVEETFYARKPLDVLAQQLVAMVALEPQKADELYATVRGAAPFSDLPRSSFDNVLDLLAGRYPSDEFSELRPRVTWDRITGDVSPRRGAQRLAILNAGTIPDRGLYGVFLADGENQEPDGRSRRSGKRVGELDEEMVFETRPGDVFLLGASSWRVMDITRDRVLVTPAPGEPGRMPFWRGDGPGRPLEFGAAIGQLTRRLLSLGDEEAQKELQTKQGLEEGAARNLLKYLREQAEATDVVPSDKTIVVECFVDEIGDWRVAVLSPFGARVHAPWAIAVTARLKNETADEVDLMWTDDGIMFRLPESDSPPDLSLFFPDANEVEEMVVEQLGSTALFASHFRENAARALLLPKRYPGKRSPLWLQRRRSADLLAVASRYPSFPILLETYRECLLDVFDIRGLKSLLRDVESKKIRTRQVETSVASPFASSLMFNYIGNFIYDGDAPLAERRAATLALDHAQLRELLGDAELRELIDAEAVGELSIELQRLDRKYPLRDADGLHDLLLYIGDLTREEIGQRAEADLDLNRRLEDLLAQRRVIELTISGEKRYAAAEDAARFRDAIGYVAPIGLPDAFLESVSDPVVDLVARFARTNVPFKVEDVTRRLGIGVAAAREALMQLADQGRVVRGEFLPGGRGHEFCDAEVLKRLKRRSLARLREQIEPVEPIALGRFLPRWHSIDRPRRGLDGLLDTIQQLQGLPLPASDLERQILPARVEGYRGEDLDELCVAGEIVWQGTDDLGRGDGRVALFLTDHLPNLVRMNDPLDDELSSQIRLLLEQKGALFFADLERATGVFRNDLLEALWSLVWNGEVTNDSLAPLRSLRRSHARERSGSRRSGRKFRSRRIARLAGSEGRWSLIHRSNESPTVRQTALANQLLERYGIVTRELVASERPIGGFAGLYPVFKGMEDAGRLRRGYFVAGMGAAQFAFPGAEDRIREKSEDDEELTALILAASDPANPYGTAMKWPELADQPTARPSRSAGARVVLCNGELAGYLNRSAAHLRVFLPDEEPRRTKTAHCLAAKLAELATETTAVFFENINGVPASENSFAEVLEEHGFSATSRGLLHRRLR